MTIRFPIKNMTRTRCLFATLLIPVVLLHLAWITPRVEWSCLCPENHPNYGCCCNCPKCIKNRGGFKSFCHLKPERVKQTQCANEISIFDIFSCQASEASSDNYRGRRELVTCQCGSHIKKISLDIMPFIPQVLLNCACPFPVVRIILADDWRPPEPIPCHPNPPG